MVKAIIFDIDGVLINGELFSTILERDYGISRERTLPFFSGIFQECLTGQADLKQELNVLLKEWGWKKTTEEFLTYWFTSQQNIDKDLLAYIEQLKKQGINMYVATNQEKYRTDYLWNSLGFSKIFKAMFSSAHLGHRKHERKFFEKMLEQIKDVKKSEVLLWDDTQINIDVAKAYGIHGEFYHSFEEFKQTMEKYL